MYRKRVRHTYLPLGSTSERAENSANRTQTCGAGRATYGALGNS